MLKEAIYHRPKDNYAYAYDEKTIHIRIHTKRDDVHSAALIYGDPYEWQDGKWITASTPMKKTGSTELFDYWSVSIKPKFKRLRYGFELKNDVETLIYTERGFFLIFQMTMSVTFSAFHSFMQKTFSEHHPGLKTQYGIKFSRNDSLTGITH